MSQAIGALSPLPYGVGPLGWFYIGFHLLTVWGSFRSRGKIDRLVTLPPRSVYFLNTIAIQLLMLTVALLVSKQAWMRLPVALPSLPWWGAGIAVALVLAALMRPLWKKSVAKRNRRLHFFMPADAREKALWTGVSFAAGIGEEVAYRGVLFVLLYTLTGSPLAGALLSALIFAAAHAIQSWLSMAIIFGFALLFQVLAFASGTLVVPMIAHVVYDVIAGFTYSRLGREASFHPELEPAPAAAAAGPTPAPVPGSETPPSPGA